MFPQHVFAQIPKEDNKQIVFNTENNTTITAQGVFITYNINATEALGPAEKPVVSNNALIAVNDPVTEIKELAVKQPVAKESKKPVIKKVAAEKRGPTVIVPDKEYNIVATAYSSTMDQTDSSPFITASGTHVHDGTIAANFLKFGAKVKIPYIFGDKIFTVEDRMRDNYKVDVWFPSREQALKFGVKRTRIVVAD